MVKEKTIDILVIYWIISIGVSFLVGISLGLFIISPDINKIDYVQELNTISYKINTLKEDTNKILNDETSLTYCKLQLQAYKDKLLYMYGDNLESSYNISYTK